MIKQLLASGLTALALAAPAQSSWISEGGFVVLEQHDLPESHHALFQALTEAAVPVLDGASWAECAHDEHSFTGGFYIPRYNIIVLCTNTPDPEPLATLVHEAVHAVQDCRAGQGNDDLIHAATQGMIDDLPMSDKEAIASFYPADQWMDEVEARYLDRFPNYVAGELTTYCL